MRIIESCAECLYNKQKKLSNDSSYLNEIKSIIDTRGADDSAPYLVYLFNRVYEKHFGKKASFKEIKTRYNNLVLSMEDELRHKINASDNSLATALMYARIGNYIDFAALDKVDKDTFLAMFETNAFNEKDKKTLESFVSQCSKAKNFLLLADNCGEIVLDKLFIEQLKKAFPNLAVTVMVRGGEAMNDATVEDAEQVGLEKVARVLSNGYATAGTIYKMLPIEAKKAFDEADVILAKGQGNYESLYEQGFHVFYSFLCKCELFTSRFNVPSLTGMFIEE